MRRIWVFVCCIAPLSLMACAPALLKKGEMAQIVDVTVTKAQPDMGTENLIEEVRYKVQNAAYRFSEQGPEHTLEVHITGFDAASAIKALLVSGHSLITAKVNLVNKATGEAREPFETWGNIARLGGIIGAIQSESVNPIDEEQALATDLAQSIMGRIYGGDWAERVVSRKPTKQASPNYPISYADARKKFICAKTRRKIEEAKARNDDRSHASSEREDVPELPKNCQTM